MNTNKKIREICNKIGVFGIKDCHIAHVRSFYGIPGGPSRRKGPRKHPCPQEKWEPIKKALQQLGLLP